jgi:hypothetical protein
MGFQPFAFFAAADSDRAAPTVSFTPTAPAVSQPAPAPPPAAAPPS